MSKVYVTKNPLRVFSNKEQAEFHNLIFNQLEYNEVDLIDNINYYCLYGYTKSSYSKYISPIDMIICDELGLGDFNYTVTVKYNEFNSGETSVDLIYTVPYGKTFIEDIDDIKDQLYRYERLAKTFKNAGYTNDAISNTLTITAIINYKGDYYAEI